MAGLAAHEPSATRRSLRRTSRHNVYALDGEDGSMVRKSTWVILAGVLLLPVPIPPFATIAGILLIVVGLALRFSGR